MIASGLIVLAFVIIHVKQFKFGTFYLASGSDTMRDLYRTEIEVFRNPLWVGFYVIATLLVGLAHASRHLERVSIARPGPSALHATDRRRLESPWLSPSAGGWP